MIQTSPRYSEAPPGRRRAVVVGASMAGLLAARALSEHFDDVVVVERDALTDGQHMRKGVPQAGHLHALLARGGELMEELFPGLTRDLIADGAVELFYGENVRNYHFGGFKAAGGHGLTSLAASRTLLEGHILRRVRALPNVRLLDAHDVKSLSSDGARRKITGVMVAPGGDAAPAEPLSADLVVDAGGRVGRAAHWLVQMGYPPPPVSEVKVHVGYATRVYRRPAVAPHSWRSLYVLDLYPGSGRVGAIFYVEDQRWMATLAGSQHDYPPSDEAGFLAFAKSLPSSELHDVLASAEPLGDIITHRIPSNLRRHYERMERLPEGLVVLGDAFCCFNPVYGQGMTAAAECVAILRRELAARRREGRDLDGLSRELHRKMARKIDIPWLLSTFEDWRNPRVPGARPPGFALLNAYLAKVHTLSLEDPDLVERFFRVMNMVAPPTTLFAPSVVARVLVGAGKDALTWLPDSLTGTLRTTKEP